MVTSKTKILKGGMSMNAPKYSEPVRRFAVEQIKNRRPLMVELSGDAIRGVRFNDDNGVVARIESNYTEEEFMACPGPVVDAMLIDAAQSDHWYTFEKRYEDGDDYGPDSDEENDDE